MNTEKESKLDREQAIGNRLTTPDAPDNDCQHHHVEDHRHRRHLGQ